MCILKATFHNQTFTTKIPILISPAMQRIILSRIIPNYSGYERELSNPVVMILLFFIGFFRWDLLLFYGYRAVDINPQKFSRKFCSRNRKRALQLRSKNVTTNILNILNLYCINILYFIII